MLCFYVIGYIVIASANDINTIAAGIVIYAVGYTGLQLLTQIIIADITTMRWRAFVSSLVSMPFVVNGFIGPNISSSVLEHAGWRWGCKLSPLVCLVRFADFRQMACSQSSSPRRSFR